MTKLIQWLSCLLVLLAIYITLIWDLTSLNLSYEWRQVILLFPVYLLIVFGSYSLAVIGYRVATFNDCTEAAKELKMQIEEAHSDLKKKGFKS